MAFTALEWIALAFIVLGIIKLIVISVNKKEWLPVVKEVYHKPALTGIVSVVLAAIVFYFLLQELSIVQIIAVMAFTGLLMVLGFLQFSDEFLGMAKKMLRKKFSFWLWVYILIWAVLMVWALKEIFF